MGSVFVKVLVSDRLPSESGFYHTNNGYIHFLSGCKSFMGCEPQWWIEEVNLPTEQEIEKESDKGWVRSHFKAGANFILDLIKERVKK